MATSQEEPLLSAVSIELTQAVELEQWGNVERLVNTTQYSPELCQWAIEKIIKTTDEEDIVCNVLDLCASDNVVPVFSVLIERGLWEAVNRLVSSNKCGPELRHRAVTEAVRNGDDNVRISRIVISHCAADQVDAALSHLIKRQRWKAVSDLISSKKCNSEQIHWALEELMKHATDDVLCGVVHLHTADQADSLWSHLIRRELGNSVGRLMNKSRCSDEQRCKAIETVAEYADEDVLCDVTAHCANTVQTDSVWSHLFRRGMWKAVEHMMNTSTCSDKYRLWAVEEASEHADDKHMCAILDHCAIDQIDALLLRLIRRSLWRSVDKLIKSSKCSEEQRRLAAKTVLISKAHHCAANQLDKALSYFIVKSLWIPLTLVLNHNNCSDEQRRTAIEKASEHAPEGIVYDVIDLCPADQIDTVLSHLIIRYMWRAVARVLERGVSDKQHRKAVEEASQYAGDANFIRYLLPHCVDEELDQVISHLKSRGLWRAVGAVLKRGVDDTQHRKVFEEAVHYANENDFVDYILPHCLNEDMERVLSHLKSRGFWRAVGAALKLGVSGTQHRRAVEEAILYADENDFVDYIFPHCLDEEFDQMISHLMSRAFWRAIGAVLERGVSDTQHKRAVEQASRQAGDDCFLSHILPQCVDEELEQVLTHLLSQKQWRVVGKVLKRGVSVTQHRRAVEEAIRYAGNDNFIRYILPYCVEEEMEQVMTHLVSQGLWYAVGKVLEHGISGAQDMMAIEEARKHGFHDDFVFSVLSAWVDEETEHTLTHLVPRGLFRGGELEHGISSSQHRWAVVEASKHAGGNDFDKYILPHCVDEELELVITNLVSRGLWKTVGEVLKRDISSSQHREAVEEASQCASGNDFFEYVLPQCVDEELEEVITHLVARDLWRSVGEVLKRDVGGTQHRRAVEEAIQRADNDDFERYILCHCTPDELVSVVPRLVAIGRYQVLRRVVRDTLLIWATSEQDSGCQNTVFWVMIHSCRVGLFQALDLLKVVTQDTRFDAYILAGKLNRAERRDTQRTAADAAGSVDCPSRRWHTALCEVLFTSLSHALCQVMSSDGKEYRDSTRETRQSVANIYKQLTSCIRDNTDSVGDGKFKLGIIQNKEEWTSVFTDLATTHQTDPLFFLHFLQGLNFYLSSRRGENDDIMLLIVFTIMPLFPQLQSVALKIMLREKRWDIIGRACRSHLWEHDRRQLFKEAVEQGQWDIVKLWADHRLQEDQRFWALEEAYKEKQWDSYLLLADHGLTEIQLMGIHYNVAKYGDWSTVLQMFERGGDVAEVMWKLFIARSEPQKPRRHEMDDTLLNYRLEQLQKLERNLRIACHKYSRHALEFSHWSVVLYKIIQGFPEYIVPAMQKAQKTGAWQVVVQLVRLGMTDADRDTLFPEMVAQEQWGVCRKLLEHGISDHLCQEALPKLQEKNQWFLIGLAINYNVGIGTIRKAMECAFQRREGGTFLQCLALVEDNPLSDELWKTLFHQAISRNIWEIVKRLVARHDNIGFQHRDIALLEALEQHLWDVVDQCLLHGADISVKDDGNETALHRETREREWKAVKEIVYRDGEPNVLDKYEFSVLNRLINDEQWDTVEFVITYGADIHFPGRLGYMSRDRLKYIMVNTWSSWLSGSPSQQNRERYRGKCSPLQGLLDDCQLQVIKFTLMWCPDQWLGVNCFGETALHMACLTEQPRKSLHYFLARKVDPLAVTRNGLSALAYAVLGECPEVMVATCIRFGFSTHQPSLTTLPDRLDYTCVMGLLVNSFDLEDAIIPQWMLRHYLPTDSPLLLAILRPQRDDTDMGSVIRMLYESGACCQRELFWLYEQLCIVMELRGLETFRGCFSPYLVFLKEVAYTPRSLKSSCRLTISNCIGLHGRLDQRQRKVSSLYLSDDLQNYVLFKDLWYGLCLE